MARFIFSMQNILNMKEKLEEQAKNNFAQANRSLQEALLMQKQCENRLEAGKQTLKEAMLENLKVGQIRRREDDVEIFRMYLRQQILVVKQKEKEVEVAREHLNEAMKERKTFEKLKEKAFEKFVAEENQKEQNSLIFTKLDETSSAGIMLNMRVKTNCPLSYVTWGQNVPEDIGEMDPQRVAKKLLSDNHTN